MASVSASRTRASTCDRTPKPVPGGARVGDPGGIHGARCTGAPGRRQPAQGMARALARRPSARSGTPARRLGLAGLLAALGGILAARRLLLLAGPVPALARAIDQLDQRDRRRVAGTHPELDHADVAARAPGIARRELG